MKVTGIIAEYNPFHLGHQYQIEYIRNYLKADYIVAVMSGDYVQRGTPAILQKHERARMALDCGVDLVLELPVQASTSSAEGFAFAGVSLLNGLGVIDELCFGSECGEITPFMEAARILNEEPEEYRHVLQNELKQGMSFPAARSAALIHYIRRHEQNSFSEASDDYAGLLSSPNNILGIEYCRAILKLNSKIKPVTLKREGAGYHDESLISGKLPSASTIRALIYKSCSINNAAYVSSLQNTHNAKCSGTVLPEKLLNSESCRADGIPSGTDLRALSTLLADLIPARAIPVLADSLCQNAYITSADFDEILHYCLLNESRKTLTEYADMSPELADRIIKKLNDYEGFEQFTDLLKTKEMTRTRIQRALLHTMLHIKTGPDTLDAINKPDITDAVNSSGRKNIFPSEYTVLYARILGFRRDSAPLLSEIKKRSSLPLLTKTADAEKILSADALDYLETNTRSSNIYESILCKKEGRKFVHEYQKQLVIL